MRLRADGRLRLRALVPSDGTPVPLALELSGVRELELAADGPGELREPGSWIRLAGAHID